MALSSKEKKELARQRKENAKQAQKFHKEQEKRAKKSSSKSKKQKDEKPAKPSASKIEEAVNSGKTAKFQKISREEKFRRESEEKIRNLKPQDFEDGYYIDEYSEKQRRERRAQVIRKQETETIRRNKKPMTSKQIRIRRILIYDDQIISYSNVSLQQNIFISKMNSTPQDIIDNFAYVEDARVDFNIPDTITITITDAVPAYYMTEGNNYLLISAKGRVLERTETKPDGLPELICGEVTGKEVGEYIKFDDPSVPDLLNTVANSLSDNSFTGIVGFDVTDTTAITLDYEGRIKINVGVAEDLDYKLRTAQAIIDKKLDPNHTGQVYGNLDVSTCAKNKMSHYVPAATVHQATMATSGSVPSTTAPADGSGDGTDWGDYSDDLYGLYGVYNWEDNSDEWSDDNNTDWNDNNGEGGYDNGGYDGGGSQNNGYDGEVPEY